MLVLQCNTKRFFRTLVEIVQFISVDQTNLKSSVRREEFLCDGLVAQVHRSVLDVVRVPHLVGSL